MDENQYLGFNGYGVDYRNIYEDSKNVDSYSFNVENVNNVKKYNKPNICMEDDKKETVLKVSNKMASRVLYASFLMIICLGLFVAFVDSLDVEGISVLVSKINGGLSTIVMERQSF